MPDWTDIKVKKIMSRKDVVYVFGGSTVFGDGVPDGSTVVAYLNSIDNDKIYINFGVEAYDSLREVDKLLYLLRKGYRPKTVIFIDGLNEVTTFARSPYEVHDTPRAQGLVLDRGEVPLVFGVPKTENMLLAFAYSFPVTHLVFRFMKKDVVEDVFIRKSATVYGLDHWLELMDFHYNWAKVHVNRVDELANDIIEYYKDNIRFVEQLGKSFEFDAYFVYQPIGLLENEQQFLKQEFYASEYYAVYKGVDIRIRKEIERGGLLMKDCSRAIAESGAQLSYVDATHYSPAGNGVLAECVLQKTSGE